MNALSGCYMGHMWIALSLCITLCHSNDLLAAKCKNMYHHGLLPRFSNSNVGNSLEHSTLWQRNLATLDKRRPVKICVFNYAKRE